MAKTVYNWSKVSNHLHQHEASEVYAINAKIGALLQPSKKLSGVKVTHLGYQPTNLPTHQRNEPI